MSRTVTFFRGITLMALVAVGAWWGHEHAVAAELSARRAALHESRREWIRLRAERDHRREAQATFSVSVDSIRGRAPEQGARPPLARMEAKSLEEGTWTPAAAWKNEGRSTPQSAVATLLWAAAGGDLTTLQTTLEFDEATRAEARAWFDTLPPVTRALYAGPEDLVASVTIKNINPASAQLSWFHLTDAEHAIVGVQLVAPELSLPRAESGMADFAAPSPAKADIVPHSLTVLNLRRSASGWRVVVPATAIARVGQSLHAPSLDQARP
mgnify:CR=1 FL=1